MTAFSVLEQAHARAGAAPGEPFREALTLAARVEELGYARFWVAEHHAMSGAKSSAPEVLIGHVAAATSQLRVGSGGILLPNHRPLHVAEVFCTLEALYPGRIDLGIGRSEGATDDAIVQALGRRADSGHGTGFGEQIDELLAFGGVRALPAGHPFAGIRATAEDVPLPQVFVLGSSLASADTAAARGLGYAFAAYTNPTIAASALRRYRERFVPARHGDRPHAILGLRVVIGDDDEHAHALGLPGHLTLVQHRAGSRAPLMSVEDALRHRLSEAERAADALMDQRADVVAGPERAGELLAGLIADSQADEVIATTNTHELTDRLASYERLAAVVGLAAALSRC